MVSATLVTVAAAAGIVSASPLQVPTISHQPVVRFIINVTDPTTDFHDVTVNGLKLTGQHVAAGVQEPTVDIDGLYFYTTSDDTVQWAVDGDTPKGLTSNYGGSDPDNSDGDASLQTLAIEDGSSTTGFSVFTPEDHPVCTRLNGPDDDGSFVVCDHGVDGIPNYARFEVKYHGAFDGDLPKNCIAVNLLPQCEPGAGDLNGATYNHDNLIDTPCHPGQVIDIDWSKQPQC